MVLGAIWYMGFFGKVWMKLTGPAGMTPEQCKEASKGMWKLYTTQFILALLQAYVLAWYIGILRADGVTGIHNAFGIWLAFVMPTTAAACMWSGDSRSIAWKKFWIQAGYQLVLFVIFGWILGMWM
ncbi:MAG: hypothetical protein RJB39_717 [Candidatus Parcubacteria bacterium]